MSIAWLISCLVVPPREDVINGKSASSLTVRISEPPLVKPGPEMGDGNPISILQMSQRTGNFTYPLFGAGFSLAVYAFFIFLCEGGSGWNLGIFRTLGNNALAAYILHGMVGTALFQFSPKDAPIWFGLLLFGVYLGIIYLFMRHLEKHGLFLRL